MPETKVSYLHLCANNDEAGVPYNWYGFQNARSGEAYMCFLAKLWDFDPDRRGYITGIFSTNLLKDSIYCMRYFVNLCDVSNGAMQNVDAYVHDTLLAWNNGTSHYLKNIDPQIKSSHILSDTANWEEISDLYKAKGGEKYISIGNFNSDANTTMVNFGNGATRIDYYIDDVSVTFIGGKAPALGPDTILTCSLFDLGLTYILKFFNRHLFTPSVLCVTLSKALLDPLWVKVFVECIMNVIQQCSTTDLCEETPYNCLKGVED